MTPRRHYRNDDNNDSSEQFFPILANETLRPSKSPPAEPPKPPEEKVSLFWRIFGGTLLSIVALLVITVYQSVNHSINDLRTNVGHLNEAKAEFVKKDEHSSAGSRTWDKVQEIQKEVAALNGPIGQIKDRVAQVEEQAKTLVAERKEIHELQATTKERLAQFEQQLAAIKTAQKEIQTLQQMITALQEKSILRDQQFKQVDDERKELLKEIQVLRERVARIEATSSSPPVIKTASNPKADKQPPSGDPDAPK